MNSDDAIDERLRALGQGTPFPVDWHAYERSLLDRLARAQSRRARRTFWIGLTGTLAGAAATLLFSLTLAQPGSSRELSEVNNPLAPEPSSQQSASSENGDANPVFKPGAAPVVLRRVGPDGEVSEIRYTPRNPQDNRPGIIVPYPQAAR